MTLPTTPTTLETRAWLAAVFSRENASPGFHQPRLAAISRNDARRRPARRAHLSWAIRRLRSYYPAARIYITYRGLSSMPKLPKLVCKAHFAFRRLGLNRISSVDRCSVMNVALVHDYLNQRGGARARLRAYRTRVARGADIHGALRRARRWVTFSGVAGPAVLSCAHPLCEPLFPARSRRSIRARSSRSICAVTTRSSARRPLGRRACVVPSGAVHVCYINTVSRFAFAYDEYVGRASRGPFVDAPDRLGPCRGPATDALRRELATTSRDASAVSTAARATCSTAPSISIVSPSAAARRLLHRRVAIAALQARRPRHSRRRTRQRSAPRCRNRSAETSLRELARGTTTTMLGFVSRPPPQRARRQRARGDRSGEEDFGLVPLEAAAAGRPAIAYRAGGALETIVEGETGAFFDDPNAESLAAALRTFDPSRFDAAALARACRARSRPRASSRVCAISSTASIERNAIGTSNRAWDEMFSRSWRHGWRLILRFPENGSSRSHPDAERRGFESAYLVRRLFASTICARRMSPWRSMRRCISRWISTSCTRCGTGQISERILQTLVNLRHGSSWNYGEWRAHFGVHDSWVLSALVPLVVLFPSAQTLIVSGAAVAFAAIPLALHRARARLDGTGVQTRLRSRICYRRPRKA